MTKQLSAVTKLVQVCDKLIDKVAFVGHFGIQNAIQTVQVSQHLTYNIDNSGSSSCQLPRVHVKK